MDSPGAAIAIDGCILLNVERMNRILEIDPANRLVVTQPGIFNADLSRAVAEFGLYYPPDPASWEFCSIGGNLSTNSGGLCCVKYGGSPPTTCSAWNWCWPMGACCGPADARSRGWPATT